MKVKCPKCEKILLDTSGDATAIAVNVELTLRCVSCGAKGVVVEDEVDEQKE